MPLSKYFKGHGEDVMSSMKKTYGAKAKKVFYATANKQDNAPIKKNKKKFTIGPSEE